MNSHNQRKTALPRTKIYEIKMLNSEPALFSKLGKNSNYAENNGFILKISGN